MVKAIDLAPPFPAAIKCRQCQRNHAALEKIEEAGSRIHQYRQNHRDDRHDADTDEAASFKCVEQSRETELKHRELCLTTGNVT